MCYRGNAWSNCDTEEEINWLIEYKRKLPNGHGIEELHLWCKWSWTIGYPADRRHNVIRSLPHIMPKTSTSGGLET